MNSFNLSEEAGKNIEISNNDGLLTISLNQPKKLNGWTIPMMEAIKEAFNYANNDDSIKVVILTAKGDYYSAGVDLGRSLKLMHPKKLRQQIIHYNQHLFETFLNLSKPILVAINGPAIGASVTSATLCDAVIAAENATFSTPFAKLGVTPEGCSSIQFPRLIGKENATRLLGKEGWKPNAIEALSIGLIQKVVTKEKLPDEATKIARDWISQQKHRTFLAASQLEELKTINVSESKALADAFFGAAFLRQQARFFWSKKKRLPSLVFLSLWLLRPLWKKLL